MFDSIGVYIIENLNTNKFYIGSTVVSFNKRIKDHLSDLRRGNHHSKKLQRSFKKHGESSFRFRVLEVCRVCNTRQTEQKWINKMQPFYNMTMTVGNIDNHTYDTKLKISKLQGGKRIEIYDKRGDLVKTVNLQHEAAAFVGGSQPKIWRCLQGISRTHMGYRFKYVGEDFLHVKKSTVSLGMLGKRHSESTKKKMGPAMARGKFKGILEVIKDGKVISKFLSLGEAAKSLKIRVAGISKSLKNNKAYKGYKFNKIPLVADSKPSGIERGFKESK